MPLADVQGCYFSELDDGTFRLSMILASSQLSNYRVMRWITDQQIGKTIVKRALDFGERFRQNWSSCVCYFLDWVSDRRNGNWHSRDGIPDEPGN